MLSYSLRNFRLDDCQDLARHLNNRNITQLLSRVPEPYHESDAREFISGLIDDEKSAERRFCNRAITVNDRVIGCVGFTLDPETKSGVIGYWLAEEYWGRGIMTHAARQMIDYAFSTLHLVTIKGSTKVENIGSQNVLKKLGFKYVGDGTVRTWNGDVLPVKNYELSNTN